MAEELVFEITTVRSGEVVTETVSVVVQPVTTVKRPKGYALADWDEDQDVYATGSEDAGETRKRGLFATALAMMFSAFRIRNAEEDQR